MDKTQEAARPAPQATDEQVAAGIAAAAALDPVLRSLYPSEVRAIYAAMVEAGAQQAPTPSLALTAFIQDVEQAQGAAFLAWAQRQLERKHRGQVFLDNEDVLELEQIVAKAPGSAA